jgi:hypothetical protein
MKQSRVAHQNYCGIHTVAVALAVGTVILFSSKKERKSKNVFSAFLLNR